MDNSSSIPLPLGKLPPELLAKLLARAPLRDPRVLVGPGLGLDCAVIDLGERLLVLKSDPITFLTEQAGWYLVHVNANDIACTGATPRWLLLTLLLPEGRATETAVRAVFQDVFDACEEAGISVIGGHTEITHGLDRTILSGTLIGEVARERLVTPRGACPGDRILVTKGVPIEGTAILAREFRGKLDDVLSEAELQRAAGFLYDPGISILRDARLATNGGKVTAMHDPTEGGLSSAVCELAVASGTSVAIDREAVPVPELSSRICAALGLDPLATIASGALLLTAPAPDAHTIQSELQAEGIRCAEIGYVEQGAPAVWLETPEGREALPWPVRDEIARLFEKR